MPRMIPMQDCCIAHIHRSAGSIYIIDVTGCGTSYIFVAVQED